MKGMEPIRPALFGCRASPESGVSWYHVTHGEQRTQSNLLPRRQHGRVAREAGAALEDVAVGCAPPGGSCRGGAKARFQSTIDARLAALDWFQASCNLTEPEAEAWARRVRAERRASSRKRGF